MSLVNKGINHNRRFYNLSLLLVGFGIVGFIVLQLASSDVNADSIIELTHNAKTSYDLKQLSAYVLLLSIVGATILTMVQLLIEYRDKYVVLIVAELIGGLLIYYLLRVAGGFIF